jgi:hypothetical protein
MTRIVWYVVGSVAMVATMLLVAWAANGFEPIGLHGNVLIALILGSVGATALAIFLMALVFHSDRSGRDEIDR